MNSFACRYPIFPTPFVEKFVLFPLMILAPLWKVNSPYIWRFISGLSITFHWFMCLFFMPVAQCFDYYSFVVSFETSKCETSNFVLPFQDCFGYLGFHMNFRMDFFSYFCKETSFGFWQGLQWLVRLLWVVLTS